MSGFSPSSMWSSSGKRTSNSKWMPETCASTPRRGARTQEGKDGKTSGRDARKPTIAVYDSFVGAQVKAEQGCIVAPTLKTAEFE
ncbi:hypothetical protein R1flu_011707 [Riccia fluitans]|uniref:Uncharacterized protein n=1 Tax=Riccia fluitans TaxID=41844 RepID=A0ABD1Z9G6_9MARC